MLINQWFTALNSVYFCQNKIVNKYLITWLSISYDTNIILYKIRVYFRVLSVI